LPRKEKEVVDKQDARALSTSSVPLHGKRQLWQLWVALLSHN